MAEPTFEEKLAQLENIVNQLEQGDVPLEKALDQFKAGVKLSQDLEKTFLKTAEKTVTGMVSDDGTTQPFSPKDDQQ